MNNNAQKLYEVASEQNGLFTAFQAIRCGYPRNNHTYHVKMRNWTRITRGVYKLVQFPENDLEHLTAVYLWTRNANDIPQGVYSHETALDIYDLSDINPSKIHLSVPKKFRNIIADDLGLIELHKRELNEIKVQEYQGIKVTTPLQTLLDIVTDNVIDKKLVIQVVNQAFEKGLVSVKEFKKHGHLKKYLRGKNAF